MSLELQEVSVSYKNKENVLDRLSISIKTGEFIVILGPSGAGKSTLLHSISGLITPDQGKIFVHDVDVTFSHPKDRELSIIFQSYALYPSMTVYGNLEFGLRMRGVLKSERDKKVRSIAKLLEITKHLDKYPDALSGGEKQRVAIGRAIITDKKVLLLDEPLSNLDAKLRIDLRIELDKLHNKLNNTMIYVTHDQHEALTLADRIIIVNGGKIQQVGPPKDIYKQPANQFVAEFIGLHPINKFACRFMVQHHSVDIMHHNEVFPMKKGSACDNHSLLKEYPGTLMIRPESVSLKPIKDAFTLDAQPDFIQFMGTEQLLLLSYQSQTIKVLIGIDMEVELGKPITLYFPKDKHYVFDADGERVH